MSVDVLKSGASSWLTFSNVLQVLGVALLAYPAAVTSGAVRICLISGGLVMFVNHLASKRPQA